MKLEAAAVREHPQLLAELWRQQQSGQYVDLTLVFSCGTICEVHRCVMAAMSRYLKDRIDSMEVSEKPLSITGV